MTDRDFVRIALHRYLLGFYSLIVGFIFISNASAARDAVPISLRLASYGSSVSIGVGTLFGGMAISRWISERRGQGRIGHFPIALACAISASVCFGEFLGAVLFGDGWPNPLQLLLKLVFYICTVEIASTIAMYLLLPPIMSDLHGRKYRRIADMRPVRVTHDAMQPAAPLLLPCPPENLLRLRVTGSRVQVWHAGGMTDIAGPLAAVLAGLPDATGVLVHRSEWIGAAAIADYGRIGRNHVLTLSNGDVVHIASSRHAAVEGWLQRHKPALLPLGRDVVPLA